MKITYDNAVEEIKNLLSFDQIYSFLADLGAEPQEKNGIIICRTVCHHHLNEIGEAGHKLYYYENTKLFKCYTSCGGDSFDIFDLVTKIKKLEGNTDWTLFNSVNFVASYFSISIENAVNDKANNLDTSLDWQIIDKLEKKNKAENKEKSIELKYFDEKLLNALPSPYILDWIEEGMTEEVLKYFNIKYNPISQAIIIPHYDINDKLVGIRERTLIEDNEKFGKYKPSIINNTMYNHPLGFNLYGLNKNKNSIAKIQKAILFESEKSVLLYGSYAGINNNIACASCGSSFTRYQFDLIKSLGVQEIIVAFDRQYQEVGDDEYNKWTKKLLDFAAKYGNDVQMSFILDFNHLLDYKDSPIDKGFDIFLKLFNERKYCN